MWFNGQSMIHDLMREIVPGINGQEVQLREAIERGRELPPLPLRKGPHFDAFEGLLRQTDTELRALGDGFVPEDLLPHEYKSDTGQDRYARYDKGTKGMLTQIGLNHRTRLRGQGSRLAPSFAAQHIPEGVLALPPVYPVAEQVLTGGPRLCMNAVYRMVHSGLTGDKLSEMALYNAVRSSRPRGIGTDSDYLNMLRLPPLADRVRVASFMGADLDFIGSFARKLHKVRPAARLYTLLNLASTGGDSIWHTNVLAAADGQSVLCLDPARQYQQDAGLAVMDTHTFARRWGVAANRGHFVIDWENTTGSTAAKEKEALRTNVLQNLFNKLVRVSTQPAPHGSY